MFNLTGAITGAVTTPLDVIKTRLMVQGSTKQYTGICHCVNTILREEGSSAFFRGMGPRVLWIVLEVPYFLEFLRRRSSFLPTSALLQRIEVPSESSPSMLLKITFRNSRKAK
ncbi:UNVERIFIED_CONTAM: S-adenosylmethionine carrier 1, chloroplastic/mitochondrial [Sesamum angustifolium]|uniref:S-adenosylmethionine carrier 1, chloroplastic/mitochondrial n=1 Tax=Sesamum angustifolium TaxID=2727405 RepID=A0AAW2ITW3_9LAMI